MNWRKDIIHPLICLKNHQNYLNYLKYLQKSQFFRPEDITNHKLRNISKILISAYEYTDFYHERFHLYNLKGQAITSIEDLIRYPKLQKVDIQENGASMISSRYNEKSLIKDKTGGSTARPLEFFYDAHEDVAKLRR